MIDSYLKSLQEGYVFSDKTISVNLDKFENGTNKKLLIVGVLGSGKSDLAEFLSKKYKVSVDPSSDQGYDLMIPALKNSKRMILEGAQLALMYKEEPSIRKLIQNQSIILLGMSAIKAGLRGDKRDGTIPGKVKDWKGLYIITRGNLTYFQKYISYMRKDILKLPGVDIQEFIVPKMKPRYY